MFSVFRRHRRHLFLPLCVWGSWLGIGVWSCSVLARQELMPYAWPLATLTVLMLGASVLLAGQAISSLIKRQERHIAWGTLLWGTVPFWLMLAHIGFVYSRTYQRLTEINQLTLSLLPVALAVGQTEAALRYPHRIEGQRVVMFHQNLLNGAEMVTAADQYLQHLESVLGRPQRSKVYWIRGPLLGRQYFSVGTFAMSDPLDGVVLSHIDRHELAHAAIHQHFTVTSRPAMVLVEGWAEVCANADPDTVNFQAFRDRSWSPSISELVGPDWAWVDEGPVYQQGAALVNLLLQRYGGHRFLELYLTSTPSTFNSDCQRVLGISLAELERQYETHIADWTEGRRIRRMLSRLPIAAKVDRTAWNEFIDAYSKAVDGPQMQDHYEAQWTSTSLTAATPEKAEQSRLQRLRYVRDSEGKVLTSDTEVIAFKKHQIFTLHRSQSDQPWKLRRPSSPFPGVNRWYQGNSIQVSWSDSLYSTFDWHETSNWDRHPPQLVEFFRDQNNTDPLVHLTLKREPNSAGTPSISRELTFSPADHWHQVALKQSQREWGSDVLRSQTRLCFEKGFVTEFRSEWSVQDESNERQSSGTTNIQFVYPPAVRSSDLTPDHFGLQDPVVESTPFILWPFLACLVLAGLQLGGGLWLHSYRAK